MKISSELFTSIINKPFFQDILNEGGECFFVGGSVRDFFLKCDPKDIDLVVRLLQFEQLSSILSKYGKVDLVGESFGVIKFKEFETDFESEIALPRTDSLDKTKKGHTAIIAQSEPMLSLEADLRRRDFCINCLALSYDLVLIDPFDGLTDIRNGVIRAVDKNAFIDDSLRILRAAQFSARFGFVIEEETRRLMKKNGHLIKEITVERILMEFQKVIDKKGDWILFLNTLDHLGLWEYIFDFKMNRQFGVFRPTTISELLFFTVRGEHPPINNWGDYFEEKLKIDTKTKKELRALELINSAAIENFHVFLNRRSMFKALQICPWGFDLPYFELFGIDKKEFNIGQYPMSFRHLDIKGEEFLEMGLEGKQIGDMQRMLVDVILENKLENDNKKIRRFINSHLGGCEGKSR